MSSERVGPAVSRSQSAGPWLGLLFLAPPLALAVCWAVAVGRASTQADRVAIFLAPLPPGLRRLGLLSICSLALCTLAIAVSGWGLTRTMGWRRVLSTIVVLVAGLLWLWQLFTMM